MAIQLLKKCEDENRNATPEEQEILSRYVGWGGLADAFDETKAAWETEYLELKTVLTPEEYAAARASTLNAHYTQPIVIESMYQVLENLEFTKGNILEPSMGVGNFFGMLPENLNQSKLYGVELVELQSCSIQMPIFRLKVLRRQIILMTFLMWRLEMCHLVHTRSMTISMTATIS